MYDYLVRYGYSKAAQGLEQDVPELSQRPQLPLKSNFVLDSWQAYWDNQHIRARKQVATLNPQYIDVRRPPIMSSFPCPRRPFANVQFF